MVTSSGLLSTIRALVLSINLQRIMNLLVQRYVYSLSPGLSPWPVPDQVEWVGDEVPQKEEHADQTHSKAHDAFPFTATFPFSSSLCLSHPLSTIGNATSNCQRSSWGATLSPRLEVARCFMTFAFSGLILLCWTRKGYSWKSCIQLESWCPQKLFRVRHVTVGLCAPIITFSTWSMHWTVRLFVLGKVHIRWLMIMHWPVQSRESQHWAFDPCGMVPTTCRLV